MSKQSIPVYNICSLAGEPGSSNNFMADNFEHYLATHHDLKFPHKHSFYHLVYFTEGAGSHSIDFINFDIKAGQVYFMNPGQVHAWSFKGTPRGYIINFSAHFLQQLIVHPGYLEQFSFFNGLASRQVIAIPVGSRTALTQLFEAILSEQEGKGEHREDFIRTLLLQLLYTISRTIKKDKSNAANNYKSLLFRNFQSLVDEYFSTKKLSRDYAAMLYITPNHLNALSKDVGGRSAGEIIRDRILLEAKRLLVNAEMNIAEIAAALDFEDNSYFTKFFKKYEGLTPQEFRKQQIK
jgi:AraC-like DNA-binding protein